MFQVFKEIQEQPEKILKMVRADMPQAVGGYLSEVMRLELTKFLGRQPYERVEKELNHHNGSYPRRFTLKGIGEVPVQVPQASLQGMRTMSFSDGKDKIKSGL